MGSFVTFSIFKSLFNNKMTSNVPSAGEDVEKLGPSPVAGEGATWYNRLGKQFGNSLKSLTYTYRMIQSFHC